MRTPKETAQYMIEKYKNKARDVVNEYRVDNVSIHNKTAANYWAAVLDFISELEFAKEYEEYKKKGIII